MAGVGRVFLITFSMHLSVLGRNQNQAVSYHPPVVFRAQCKRHVWKAYSENKKGAGHIPSFLLGVIITLWICLVACVKGPLVLGRCYKVLAHLFWGAFWYSCSWLHLQDMKPSASVMISCVCIAGRITESVRLTTGCTTVKGCFATGWAKVTIFLWI